jgi:hypothetical protein
VFSLANGNIAAGTLALTSRDEGRGNAIVEWRETVVLHNNSADSLGQIVLRLDPNIFLGNTPQAAPWVPSEVTDGMVITRMTVTALPWSSSRRQPQARMAPAPRRQRPAQNAQVPNQPRMLFGKTTVARVNLPTKLLPHSNTTVEIGGTTGSRAGRARGTA